MAALVLAASGVAYWRVARNATDVPVARAPAPAPVVVADVAIRDIPEELHAIGTVIPNATVDVKTRVSGQVTAVAFREGTSVRAGDLLFRIDPEPFRAALDQARAILARDRAQLENARAALARYADLTRRQYASTQEYDQARAQARAFEATIAADEAAVTIARQQLGYTEIRAPIDGRTGAVLVQAGNILKADDAQPLVTIVQVQPIRVSFSVPQQDLPRVQARLAAGGAAARITVPGSGATPRDAGVDFLDNAVSATTGTIQLRATLDNADGVLVPGQLVEVALGLGVLHQAVTIPRDALNAGQVGPYVYAIANDGRADLRRVRVVYESGDTVVVDGPLAAGDRVVTDGQLRLAPGVPVSIATDTANRT